jgi:RNA polymerase sigma factor (sigma-70 family)
MSNTMTAQLIQPKAGMLSDRTREWSDAELISACFAGDSAAWDNLVERYARLVYSIPRKRGLSAADADDVVQAVFLTTYRRLETLRDAERISAWLIRVTHRETSRYRRSRAASDAGLEFIASAAELPEEEIRRLEDHELVRRALDSLSDRDQTLIRALFFETEEEGYAGLAKRLGVPLGSIGPTRARALKRLEIALRALGYRGSELPLPHTAPKSGGTHARSAA